MTEEKRAEELGIQVVGYLQRIFPRGQVQGRHTTAAGGEAKPSVQENHIMDNIMDLVKIMKLMKSSLKEVPNYLDLLDIICERFPAIPGTVYLEMFRSEWQHVNVSCPNHGSHSVCLFGFRCLEAIEGSLGTAQQTVELVDVDTIRTGLFLETLNNRLSRQLEQGLRVEATVKTEYLHFSKEAAEDISLLTRKSQVDARFVKCGDCNPECNRRDRNGWGLGLELKPLCHCDSPGMKLEWSALKQGQLKIGTVLGGWKEDAKGDRENLRVVWEASSNFLVISSNVVFAKESG